MLCVVTSLTIVMKYVTSIFGSRQWCMFINADTSLKTAYVNKLNFIFLKTTYWVLYEYYQYDFQEEVIFGEKVKIYPYFEQA